MGNHSRHNTGCMHAAPGYPKQTGRDIRIPQAYKQNTKSQCSCAGYNVIIKEMELKLYLY